MSTWTARTTQPHLSSDGQRVTELRLAGSELSKRLRDAHRFDAARWKDATRRVNQLRKNCFATEELMPKSSSKLDDPVEMLMTRLRLPRTSVPVEKPKFWIFMANAPKTTSAVASQDTVCCFVNSSFTAFDDLGNLRFR